MCIQYIVYCSLLMNINFKRFDSFLSLYQSDAFNIIDELKSLHPKANHWIDRFKVNESFYEAISYFILRLKIGSCSESFNCELSHDILQNFNINVDSKGTQEWLLVRIKWLYHHVERASRWWRLKKESKRSKFIV